MPRCHSCRQSGSKGSPTATFCFLLTTQLLLSLPIFRQPSATAFSQPRCAGKAIPSIPFTSQPLFLFHRCPTITPNLSHSTALFIAGVYNGAATTSPSHRAVLPPPFNIEVLASDSSYRVSTVATGVPSALFTTASFFLLASSYLIPKQGYSCALPTTSVATT
jgi:hypothetical protein